VCFGSNRVRDVLSRSAMRRLLLVLAALSGLVSVASCSSITPPSSPATTRERITDAEEARRRIDELERRGGCLEAQSAYVEMRSSSLELARQPGPAELGRFRASLDALRQQIPEAARADFDVVAAAYGTVATQLDGLDLTDPAKAEANAPRVRDALRALDDPAVKAAEQRLDTFFRACLDQPRG
jgi:hypothetical protein